MIMALQTVISRHKHSDESALLSVTQVHVGSTDNIIPDEALHIGAALWVELVQAFFTRT